MKTLIVILIIAAFLQTTIVSVDLVLLVLICRAYLKSDVSNLYLSFAFGLATSYLGLVNLGLNSLIYLVIVLATQALSKLRLAGNPLLLIPISFIFLSLKGFLDLLVTQGTLEFPRIIAVSIISLPIFYFLKIWEERFTVKKGIKLRM